MSSGTGVNVSKAQAYAVLQPPRGVNVSKALAFAVLQNSIGVDVSKALAFAVLAIPNNTAPSWSGVTLPNGVLGSAYSQGWNLSPAASPITFSLQSGSLPSGLAISTTGSSTIGALSGTPTLVGSYTFSILATNAYGSATQSFTVAISNPSSGAAAPVVVGSILGSGTVGVAYNEPLTVVGGTAPYSIALVSGAFPPGLGISGNSIVGTPISAGSSTFYLNVTDANGNSTTEGFTITVSVAGGGAFGWIG